MVKEINELLSMLNDKNKKYENKKLSELEINKEYIVKAFKSINTKFGIRCIVTLEDVNNLVFFDVFLPDRYSNIPSQTNIENMKMIYSGLKQVNENMQIHIIEFY